MDANSRLTPEEFERARLAFGKVMRIEYNDLVVHFIKYLNNGNSFGFNVQERFDPVGTTRKYKVVQYMLNTFGAEKVERALVQFATEHAGRVNPKRRGKRSWKGTARPAPAQPQRVEIENVPLPPEPEVIAEPVALPVVPEPEPVSIEGLHHKQFPVLLRLLLVRDHNDYTFPIWIPGPAGSGKTTAAMNSAKHMDLPFYHTGAVGNQYELLGFRDASGTYNETEFYKAYKNGGVFLWDEVDASNPQALVCFNAALENGHCAFPCGTVERHKDFIPVAAANTYGAGATHEYVGRNKLDAATVDRFVMLAWEYDELLELALARNNVWVSIVHKVRNAVAACGIKHVVSPRASIRGAKLLAAGFTQTQALDMCVRKGLTADQWQQVKARAGL